MGSAAGARKAAATRLGLTVDEYEAHTRAGEKWCRIHKQWHPRSEFSRDASRHDGLVPRCKASFIRTAPGPSNAERRAAKVRGEAWCSRCEAWLQLAEIHAGKCRVHRNEQYREGYRRSGYNLGASASRRRGVANVSRDTREMLIEATRGLCSYSCGRPATTLDHVIPINRGGITEPGNMVPACKPCNSAKRDHDPTPWIARMTFDALELVLPGLTYDGPVMELLCG